MEEGSKVELTNLGLFSKTQKATGYGLLILQELKLLMMPCLTRVILCWQAKTLPLCGRVLLNQLTHCCQAQTIDQGMKLVARLSETNYSSGRYHFILQSHGNLVLYIITFPLDALNFAYWASNTVDSGLKLIFNQSGFIYLEAKNGTILNMLSSKASAT